MRQFISFTMAADLYRAMKERAELLGESAAGFIKQAIAERMERTTPKNNPVGRVGEKREDENS